MLANIRSASRHALVSELFVVVVLILSACNGNSRSTIVEDSSAAESSSMASIGPDSEVILAAATEREMPLNGQCLAGSAPVATIELERILSGYVFSLPTDAAFIAGAPEPSIFVTEKGGDVRFTPLRREVSYAEVKTVLSLPVNTEGDGGLLGIAMHPDYTTNRRVFVSYSLQQKDGSRTLNLSEFTTGDDHLQWGNRKEILAVNQQSELHYGGSLRFGADGMLYMGFGDDSSNELDDPRRREAQNPKSVVGSIIRIDIDNTQPDKNYAIPADNPSIHSQEISEVFAFGFRNPWRMSFDSEPPYKLYIGDVGSLAFEEVNVVKPGKNYGWPDCEGLCESSKTGFEDPLHEYERADGRAVIGGLVYRGEKMPSLVGEYVYGDFLTKSLYAVDVNTPSSNGSFPVETVAQMEVAPTGFFVDEFQEMYVFGAATHGLYRLRENFDVGQSGPPKYLSETGCFDSLSSGNPIPADGVQEYSVNQQFWSDGATKQRYVSIPDNTVIDTSDPFNWQLPKGGVTIKHFRLDGKIFETRFLLRHNNGQYAGYTYYWNDDMTEAHLVNSEGANRQLGDLNWEYPARAQCLQCHTKAAGGSLSLESAQLNMELWSAKPREDSVNELNQIDHLNSLGLLSPIEGARLPAYPTVEELSNSDLPIDERVLSYLHVNCASCHRGERSVGRANWDARYETSFSDKELCGVEPLVGVHSVIEELIWPGDHELSALWQRATLRGSSYDMPPIASKLVDPVGRELLAEWIDGLNANCSSAD